jgi:hypothetical protein
MEQIAQRDEEIGQKSLMIAERDEEIERLQGVIAALEGPAVVAVMEAE